jgi:hypothetical protein
MNTTREEALEMLDEAKAKKDYELVNICINYVLWLDKKESGK